MEILYKKIDIGNQTLHIWPVMLAAHGLYTAYVQLYMASMLAMHGHL